MRKVAWWLCLAATCWAGSAAALDLTFDLSRDPVRESGTVFEVRVDGARCAAGFVNAVQSRVYTNQNDLELWCREDTGEALNFATIGKPAAGQFTSSIANLNGRPYEFVGRSVFDGGGWRSLRADELPVPSDALPISIQSVGEATFVFSIYGSRCEGISIYSTSGYHGSYRGADWQQWSALWTDGRSIAMNVGYAVRVGPLPPPTREACVPLVLTDSTGGGRDWVYAMTSLGDDLLYGGSEDERDTCSAMFVLNLKAARAQKLRLKECAPGYVTEIYSFTRWRGDILIGNFPHGALYAFSPRSQTTRITSFGIARPDDLPDPHWGGPYRESQSVAVTGGRVLIGMYPWAELFVQEGEGAAPRVHRLFEKPVKGRDFAPFASRLATTERVRSDPYGDRAWSQRIPTIAVFSGRICASTGNRSGENLAEWNNVIALDEVQHYGEVFCAHVPGHAMARVSAGATRLRFQVIERSLSITQDGTVIAEAAHTLSAKALARLDAASPRVGRGDYGPFSGTVRRRRT